MPSYLNYDGLQTLVSKIKYQVNSAAEKVKDTSSSKKAFLLGHESQNSIESAISDSSIYMENGALYAKEIKDVSAISHVSEKSGTKVFAANGTLFDAAPVVLLTQETSDDTNILKFSFSEEDAEKIKTHALLKYKVKNGSDISIEMPAIQQTFIDDTIIDYLKTLGYTSATMDNVYLYVLTAVGMTSMDAHAAYAFLPDSKTAVLVKLTSGVAYPDIEEQNKNVKYSIIGHDDNSDKFLYTGYVNDTSAYVLNGEIYSNGEKVLASSLLNGSVTANDTSLVTGGDIYTAIQNQVGSAVKYLGTVTSAVEITALSSAKYGDFIRATKAFQFNNESVHIGDMIILDSSADEAYKTKDNWVIVHGESDSWREVKVNGTSKIAANNSQALDVSAGENISLAYTGNKLVINSTDTNTWREVKVNGTSKIAANNSQALDVSAGENVTLSYTNNKVVITAANTDEKTTESGHYTPSATETTYGDSYPDTETVISKIDVDSKGHIVDANYEINDPIIGGENILRCTQYPIVDTNSVLDNSWIYGKFVMSNISLGLFGHPYETTRVVSPASTNREYCDAIILKNKEQYGVCQTVSNIYLENLIYNIGRSLINLDNELIHGHTVKSIPFTFSFYAKMQDEGTETDITYTPIIAQGEEMLKQASETSSLRYGDGWKKFSITRHVDIEAIKENGNLLGLGYVGNESQTPVLIACPSLTIGKYDIDWKPNPLDAKSDIVGVGNILRCSTFDYGYESYYFNITYINDEGTVASVSSTQQLPGCESLNSVNALTIGLTNDTRGITYREPGALFSNSGWHTALMNYVGNTDTEIPVSMSIWCWATADIEVALMPVSFKDCDLFAPLTYVKVPKEQWTRLTRTIYVPAGKASSEVYLGSALATYSDKANVLFALPMVTLGSIPSTWFPSVWDLTYNTSCIDTTARSNATAAQNTASQAYTLANTAKTNAATALSTANTASTAAKTAQTTADGKVSKSGDTMSGDLDMSNRSIYNVDKITASNTDNLSISADMVYISGDLDMSNRSIYNVDKITASDSDGIIITGGIDTSNAGFKVSGTAGTSNQLMQGDGKFRAIETTLSDSDNIPTSSAIKNLKIGGRNLLHGSQISSLSSNSYWFQGTFRASGSGSNTINTYTAGELPIPTITKSIKLTCGSSATEYGFCQDKYKFPTTTYTGSGYAFYKGDKVCLSCWIKPSAAGVTARILPIWDSKNESKSAGDKTITLNAGWQHVYYSGTVDSDLLISNGISIGYVYCTTKGASIEVCCPKLEYGEIPTDWTPAPEDVGGTTDIIDTTGTYTYTDSDGDTYTAPDIQMTGRIKLCSPAKKDNSGGLIQFGDGDGTRNLIGECAYDPSNGGWIPYDTDELVIAGRTIILAGENNAPQVRLANTKGGINYTAAHLVNYTPTNINLTTATSYSWYLNSVYGEANNNYSLAHTATSLAITISPASRVNYQYFMMRQSTNTCTVTLTAISGYTVVTKGNVTSFTVAAGQTIEFCAIVVGTYIYVTYTIFG